MLQQSVIDKYNKLEWTKVIEYFYTNHKYLGFSNWHITRSALKLTDKLFKELDIELFPIIIKTYANSKYCYQGNRIWNMLDKKMNCYGSCDYVSDFLKRNSKLVLSGEENIIIREQK